MAKVACGLAKPHGVLLVRAGTERQVLAPLPARKLPGIGPVSEKKLTERGILKLADVAAAPDAVLRTIFGAYAAGIRRDAIGEGRDELGRERPAFREYDPRGLSLGTISNERTFVEESHDATLAILAGLCERVGARARRRGVKAGGVTLKLRYASFHTISRSRTLAPTSVDVEIHEAVLDMYREARTGTLPIRLLGVGLSRLVPDDEQRVLFDRDDRRGRAVDGVREKFGYDAVHLATTLLRPRRRGA